MTDWAGKLNDMGLSVDQVSLMTAEEQDKVMSRLGIGNDALQLTGFFRFLARNQVSLMPVEQQDDVLSRLEIRNYALQQAEFYRLLARQMPEEEQDQAMSRLGIGNDALQLSGLIRLLVRRQALLRAPSIMHCQSQPTDAESASFAQQAPPRKKLKEGADSDSEMTDIEKERYRLCLHNAKLISPKALMNAKEGDFDLVSKSDFRYTNEQSHEEATTTEIADFQLLEPNIKELKKRNLEAYYKFMSTLI